MKHLGWFDTTEPDVLHPLFPQASTGSNTLFNPSASCRYHLTGFDSSGLPITSYSQSAVNPLGQAGDQQFEASYSLSDSGYWIAGDDLPFSYSDIDYNDIFAK